MWRFNSAQVFIKVYMTQFLFFFYICAIKQIDVSFLCVRPLIDDTLHHKIDKVCCGNHWPAAHDFHNHFDIVMTQFITIYLTNRFHVAVRLFSNKSQRTSKCGKNKKMAHEAQPSVSLMFLPHFDVLCDLLLNRRSQHGIYLFYIIKN